MTFYEILEIIDRESEPNVMSKSEAVNFYEEIIEGLRSRIEALREEMVRDR